MKSKLRKSASAMVFILASACATGAKISKSAVNEGAPTSPNLAATADALPDAALPKGSCGMILWTLDVAQPVPVFRAVSQKGAEIKLDGVVRKLSLSDAGGVAGFGVFETQTFAGEGLTVTVKVRFGLGFEGGSYLERGLVSIERSDGWKTVIPAAGIAGCRAK